MIEKIIVTLSILICGTHIMTGQSKIDQIDELVTFCQEHGMYNGTILVAENDEIIYHKALGMADFESNKSNELNTTFCLGSVSKQFTAYGIMLLKEQGKLSYPDRLGNIYPELPKYMHDITIRQLLQHTSGLKRTHYENYEGMKNEDVFQLIVDATDDALLFDSGTDLSYSNSAYILLAMIVEKISGQSFEEFLTEEIWRPLGMTHTYVKSEEDIDRSDMAVAYDGYGQHDDDQTLTYGTNGIYSTTEDLYRWTQSFMTDQLIPLSAKYESYIPAITSTDELLTLSVGNQLCNYGFGLYLYRDTLDGIIGHSGAYGGYFTNLMRDFKKNRSIITLTNNGRLLPIVDLGVSIHNILEGKEYSLPKISIDWTLRNEHYDDIDAAIEYYHQLKEQSPHKYKFDNEWELNRLGYALMQENRHVDAIKIFKLLVSEFPNSANPNDSLGEAYFNNSDYQKALKSYQNALEIDKDYFNADGAKNMIRRIKKQLKG